MELTEKQLTNEVLYEGMVVTLCKDSVSLPNGKTALREYVRHIGAVCVIPLTDKGEILLERQYRYSVGETLIEIPAGKLDHPEEDPKSAALRELREETGAVAGKLTDLGIYYGSPAIMGEKIYMYLAEDLRWEAQDLDEDEFLEVFTLPLEEAVGWVLNGTITDGKTQAAILKLWTIKNCSL